MKHLFNLLGVIVLLALTATGTRAGESRRGFYEGDLAGNGKIVFFVQANESLSVYAFDKAGQQVSYAGGPIASNGTFSLTTNSNQPIAGTVSRDTISATFLGQNITAQRTKVFGKGEHFSGRFTTTARSDSGASLDLKIVIDAQGNIFLVTKQGSTVLGGFGTITPTASPSPSPSATPSATPRPSATPTPTASPTPTATPSPSPRHGDDDDEGDDRGGGRHGSEDRDDAEDRFEDASQPTFNATFSVTLVTGQLVTGNLTFSHGLLMGDLTLNGVIYRFRAPQQSSANRLANIATRGFVNTGQGQLISGFIIRGGPKLVIVRAIGPSLAAKGVSPALADPVLQLFNDGTLVRENDDWQSASNADDVITSGVAPENAKEAAIMIRLEPGAYTTVVRGANDGTGIALVEVYEVARD